MPLATKISWTTKRNLILIGLIASGCQPKDPYAGLTPDQKLATARSDPKALATLIAHHRQNPGPTRPADPHQVATALAAPLIIAFAEGEPDTGPAPLTVKFKASIQDSNVEDLHFTWDFGDGTPPVREKNPRHQYERPGRYTARLTVEGGGADDDDTVKISVTAVQPTP